MTELVTANSSPPRDESDSAAPPIDIDSAEALDFEEQDQPVTREAEQTATETDSEPDASLEGQEAGETDDAETAGEATGDGAKAAKPASDDMVVEMPGGEKLTIAELKSGQMRDRDYRHKTTELANQRRGLEALSTRVTNSVNAIAELLTKQIPAAPDPSLAMTDPARYVADKAMHDAMMAQVASVLEQANAPKTALNTLTNEQRSEYARSENAKLAEAFPQSARPETREKFFRDAMSVAAEMGFTNEEISQALDHRFYKLAHYAQLGMQAEKAKAKAAAKVVNVPPVAPNKRPLGPNAARTRQNQEAMKRLRTSGSIDDAMAIDFD